MQVNESNNNYTMYLYVRRTITTLGAYKCLPSPVGYRVTVPVHYKYFCAPVVWSWCFSVELFS